MRRDPPGAPRRRWLRSLLPGATAAKAPPTCRRSRDSLERASDLPGEPPVREILRADGRVDFARLLLTIFGGNAYQFINISVKVLHIDCNNLDE